MIIWDTNTVYYICPAIKSQNEKCDNLKVIKSAKIEKTCISSITAYEILFKYKKTANHVRRIFSFLRLHNIGLFYHPLLPNKRIDITDLSRIKQDELTQLVNETISVKAAFEGAYAFIMFFSVFFSALCFSLPDEEKSEYILTNLLRVWQDTKSGDFTELFKHLFEHGYKTDDCEGFIKKAFEYILFDQLQYFQPLAKEIFDGIGNKTIDEILDGTELVASIEQFIKRVGKLKNTSEYVKKLAKNYKNAIGKAKYPSFKANIIKVFENIMKNGSGIFHDSMFKYCIDIYERILERGGLYLKNDILDGLILQHLYLDENDKIVTFDSGMIKHLEKYSQSEKRYQNSLNLIISLVK